MHDIKLSPGGRDPEARKVLTETERDLPNKSLAKSPAAKRLPNPTVAAVIALLSERWPCTFSILEKKRQPLKVGIFSEILVALDGAITHAELSRALGCYVANGVYLSRLREGAARIGLDGAAAGEVTKAEEDRSKMQRWLAMLERERGG